MYKVTNDGKFIIENYNWETSFSNFFPGIAGTLGIPLWAYYVSRNQGMISLGIRDKNHSIMEFMSYNKALELVGQQGFRTFLKIKNEIYEPFRKTSDKNIIQKMIVTSSELEFEEINKNLNLKFNILYYPASNTDFPAMIRKLTITNLNNKKINFEMIDGLPKIIPYGMDFNMLNVIARHSEGMMESVLLNKKPLFRLKQSPSDTEKVDKIEGGNYYFCKTSPKIDIKYIVDPSIIFDDCEIYEFPWNFKKLSKQKFNQQTQIRKNRTPCAMTYSSISINGNSSIKLNNIIGYTETDKQFTKITKKISSPNYFTKLRKNNIKTIDEIKNLSLTVSNQPFFDEYCKQTFLDNVIRGGMPEIFKTSSSTSAFYKYSRQNGDLERDYHFFIVEPTPYSQGTGHYRSVNQNRRCDSWFFPEVKDRNILTFMNLIQLDGFNPIEVNQITYSISSSRKFDNWIKRKSKISKKFLKIKEPIINNKFSPGSLILTFKKYEIPQKENYIDLVKDIISMSQENECGGIHEGYWVDHWLYNLDLIDNFYMIYPDKINEIMFDAKEYYFFDNPDVVQPRNNKYVLSENGKIHQYNAVTRSKEKIKLINSRSKNPYIMRDNFGKGEIYKTNLYVKILCMIINRMATLDPEEIGVEMDSDKPGWNDSMNGLPGILGSSLCQSLELEKAIKLLLELGNKNPKVSIFLYNELLLFMNKLESLLDNRLKSKNKNKKFIYWDESHNLKEEYVKITKFGIKGDETEIKLDNINKFLIKAYDLLTSKYLKSNLKKVFSPKGVPYTYFINKITKYKVINKSNNTVNVKALSFKQEPLPLFLEGPVHMLKVHPEFKEKIYHAVKNSSIYDKKLKMYKVCESLDKAPFEIGRVQAWGAGWIENESVYTHMLYKYLLEIIKSGLHKEFFQDIKTMLVPFTKPQVYQRSIFENVSFIVSSAFPDTKMHGRGLQPRLSGVTGEWLNMWILMCAGYKPFNIIENKLQFELSPIIPSWFFTKKQQKLEIILNNKKEIHIINKNSFAFKFLGTTLVVYENKKIKNTFGKNSVKPVSYKLDYFNGKTFEINSNSLNSSFAADIRNKMVKKITVKLN